MLSALPAPFQRQLLSFHSSAKQNNGDRAFTTEEDASILMQLKLGAKPVSQRKVVLQGRTSKAICHRWNNYLKKNVYEAASQAMQTTDRALHDECMRPVGQAQQLRRRLDSTGVDLRASVRDALVALHDKNGFGGLDETEALR